MCLIQTYILYAAWCCLTTLSFFEKWSIRLQHFIGHQTSFCELPFNYVVWNPFWMLSTDTFKIFSFHINQIMLEYSVSVVAQMLYLQEMDIDEQICRTLYLQRYCYLQGQQSDLATIQNDTTFECLCLQVPSGAFAQKP